MSLELARTLALSLIGQQKKPEDEALASIATVFGSDVVDELKCWLEKRRKQCLVMSVAPEWRGMVVRDLARQDPHYPGPHGDLNVAWRVTKRAIEGRVGEAALRRIDSQSTDVVSSLARPNSPLESRRGLVIGHVQSGKTANYTATIAKAADWGYSLVIVLAGLHTALRQQTQSRLDEDIVGALKADRRDGDWHWHWLTEPDADFGAPSGTPDALLSSTTRMIAVVKKNVKRLEALVNWLSEADEGVRQRASVLLIDDESDQASVNTGSEQRSAINRLIVQLTEVMPATSYVGFTATPFANVLIDPSDERDLYPRDFIFALDRPDQYQGSEVLFGRNELDGQEPVDGYDIVRTIPEVDLEKVCPPSKKEERKTFRPEMCESLENSLRWFLLATAARRARGQPKHSSCLIHTSRFVDDHSALAALIKEWLGDVTPDASEFESLWANESSRRTPPSEGRCLTFSEVQAELSTVISETTIAVDNGRASKDQRLSYPREKVATVIAVGGDTLSRGLTLEGLVSSYFARTSRTYDALMQMGRWFGFRPGYEDLTRLWTDGDTIRAFRHLSTVEQEIRDEIASFGAKTPSDVALRIRTHSALAVTSPAKMRHAVKAQVSYAGSRKQTTFFEVEDKEWLEGNLAAANTLVSSIPESARASDPREGVAVWHDVEAELVESFLEKYEFHEDHTDLDSKLILTWLKRRRAQEDPVTWNVAVMGRGTSKLKIDGEYIDLGTVELGPDTFNCISRAKLVGSTAPANIGALMSKTDRVIDVPGIDPEQPAKEVNRARASKAAGQGLLALYPISPSSTPLPVSIDHREKLGAVDTVVIGVGIVFPESTLHDSVRSDLVEAEYVSAYVAGEDDLTDDYIEQMQSGVLDEERSASVDVEEQT